MRASSLITKVSSMSNVNPVGISREGVVRHSLGELQHSTSCLSRISQNRQTGRCYGNLRSAVTPLFRRLDAVRSVEALQNENSLDSRILLQQKPSEKERGVPIGTAVDRQRWEETAIDSDPSRNPSITNPSGVRSVGLHDGGSQPTEIELQLNL